MYEILCTNQAIGSRCLRFLMASEYSHSVVWDAETDTVTHTTLLGGGVAELSKAEFDEHYTKQNTPKVIVTLKNRPAARAWLKEQVGKDYDWKPLISIALQWFITRSWQDDKSWFCSELTETVRSLFGKARFSVNAGWITPKHQSMLL